MGLTDRELDGLLARSYAGEAYGQAFFGALADMATDDSRREKLRALQELEAQTRDMLEPFAGASSERDGVDGNAAEAAAAVAEMPWNDFMAALLDGLAQPLADYRRIGELAPDERHADLARALVDHEKAVEAFARCEKAGESDSTRAVLALLHPRGGREVAS